MNLRAIRRRWHESGTTKKVEWRHVRLALLLGGLCLTVTMLGFAVWIADNRAQNDATAYSADLNEWKRCEDRVDSTRQIDAVNRAGVAHAEDTARTLDQIVAVFEAAGDGPRLVTIRQLVNKYQASVIAYRDAAEEFVPQDPATCPPKPDKP